MIGYPLTDEYGRFSYHFDVMRVNRVNVLIHEGMNKRFKRVDKLFKALIMRYGWVFCLRSVASIVIVGSKFFYLNESLHWFFTEIV